MQLSLHQVMQGLSPNSQIKLKLMNTLFALTIANYYVFIHHPPQTFRWSSSLKFYEIQSEEEENKAPLKALLPLLSYKAPLFFSNHPYPLFSTGPQVSFPVSDMPLMLEFLSPSPLTPPPLLPIENYDVVFNQQPAKIIHTHKSLRSSSLKNKVESLENEIASQPDGKVMLTEEERRRSLVALTNPLFPLIFSFQIDAQASLITPSSPLLTLTPFPPVESPSPVSFQQTIEVDALFTSPLLPFTLRNKRVVPAIETALQLIEDVNGAPQVVNIVPLSPPPAPIINVLPSVEEEIAPIENPLPPWNTYRVSSNNPLLRLWLMKLAPEGYVKPQQIPFRKAFIETLLLPEFQDCIGLAWEDAYNEVWEEDTLEEEKAEWKAKRLALHNAYMDKVKWHKTSFERLFTTDLRDWHQINEDGYWYAYKLPKKLGIRAYKDKDIHLD